MQITTQDVVSIVKGNTRADELETFKEEITFGRTGDPPQSWDPSVGTQLCNR
jgi:hypothetical protein